MDDSIHAEIINLAPNTDKTYYLEEVVSHVIDTRKYLGCQATKYSQTSQNKVEYHKHLGGGEVVEVINGNNVIYANKKGTLI